MEQGHGFPKTMREKTERAMAFLEEPEALKLKEEVDERLSQLEGLTAALRAEHSALEKCIALSRDFLDKYKTQAQWLAETKALLGCSVEPKAELYQKKAQLAKYRVAQWLLIIHSFISYKLYILYTKQRKYLKSCRLLLNVTVTGSQRYSFHKHLNGVVI